MLNLNGGDQVPPDFHVWLSRAHNDTVGIDSTALLMEQHRTMNKKSLKEQALQRHVKKVFKDEI